MKFVASTLLAFSSFLTVAFAGDQYCAPTHPSWGYVFGYGGVTFGPEFDAESLTTPGLTNTYDYDDGFIFGGGVGVYSDFLCGSRFEFEGLYTKNELNLRNGAPVQSGEMSVGGALVNLLKEVCLSDRLTGYIGGGIGYGAANFEVTQGGVSGAASDSMLIYQGKAGIDFCLSRCLSLFTEYKALGVSDLDYNAFGETFENEAFITHNLLMGLRLNF